VPRYLIERSFPRVVAIRVDEVVERNADAGVTWLYSYVSDDRRTAFDLYEAPSPEAIRATSARNQLPVERITEVRVLDPYSYVEEGPR
jgi:Protein of unknown function (DUF4242)